MRFPYILGTVFAAVLIIAGIGSAGAQSTPCVITSRLNDCKLLVKTPPPGNVAPKIYGTPPTEVTTGQLYSFTPTARDLEGDPLSFQIVNRPPWASFDSATGRLWGTPGSGDVGEYVEIRIFVSDNKGGRAKLPRFSITVIQGNRAPVISGTPPGTGLVGQAYAFTPNASDPDGDSLNFTIINRPAWAVFNSANGALTGTPGTGATGNFANIQIRVSDGSLTAALPAFSINVQQAALGSATLHWQAPTTRIDGSPLTNLAGYRVRYGTSPGSYPNVVEIANAGVTSAVVPSLTPATWYFVVIAYDSNGLESNQTSPVSKTIL